jgi:hypothetical protein
MAGTTDFINGNTATDQLTLTRSDPAGPRYVSQVQKITEKIYELLPNAFVDKFAYTLQLNDDAVERGYGKGAVRWLCF